LASTLTSLLTGSLPSGLLHMTCRATAVEIRRPSILTIVMETESFTSVFRRSENLIVFNTKKNGVWGTEERVTLEGKFFKPDTTVMVYDHGDRFQILVDYRTVHYFTKRLSENIRSISYFCNPGQTPVFSNTMEVITYSSMGIIMSKLDTSGTPITSDLDGFYSIAPHTADYKRMEADSTVENEEVALTESTGDVQQLWQLGCVSTGIAWIKTASESHDWYIRPSHDSNNVTSGTRLIASSASRNSRPLWKIAKEGPAYRISSEYGNLCWTRSEDATKVDLQLVDKHNSWQLWELITSN